ncbi:MAG: GNAT family N-acetyltransferase [Dermatophilaceae bacterium]
MDIMEWDRSDDGFMGQAWQVRERVEVASRVQPSSENLDEFAKQQRYDAPGERKAAALALQGGRVLGYAAAYFPDRDNTGLCWSEVLVAPEHQRQGVGSVLVGWLEDRAREECRAVIVNEAVVPDGARVGHPGRAFAESRGYAVANVEIVRRVQLPVPEDVLDELGTSAQTAFGDRYEVSVHLNGVPLELQASLCVATNRLGLDAPTGDIDYEEESLTPVDYQDYLAHEADLGRTRLTALAVERDTGVVAAYTDIVVAAGDPDLAFQWGTLVLPEHRGHRLGAAVKVANLRALSLVSPGRKAIITSNAENNPWMVQINQDLGFEIIEELLELKKDLS